MFYIDCYYYYNSPLHDRYYFASELDAHNARVFFTKALDEYGHVKYFSVSPVAAEERK